MNPPADPQPGVPQPRRSKTCPKPTRKQSPASQRAETINRLLAQVYPHPSTALRHDNPLQLLIATILSAQCTDERVNQVTPGLFARYRTAEDFAQADLSELEALIRPTGYYRNKARLIRECCTQLVERFAGQVPRTLEELVTLPGIGRKTANVVLGDAFGVPGITVDTHVKRLSQRLGLTRHTDPVKIEQDLMKLLPPANWTAFSHRLILHGRNVCRARKPQCDACILQQVCPKIGVPVQKSMKKSTNQPPGKSRRKNTGGS
jgi:endonuclease-3